MTSAASAWRRLTPSCARSARESRACSPEVSLPRARQAIVGGSRATRRVFMFGAIVSLLLVVAAAYAVTQVGGVITLLFIAAVLFLAYRRLSLLAFTVTFTVLLADYSGLGGPARIWKGFLGVLLAGLWLLNVRTLRKALITRPFMKTYLRLLPTMSQTEKEALEAGAACWG